MTDFVQPVLGFDDREQQRQAEMDRELQSGTSEAYRGIMRIVLARKRWNARNLSAKLPPGANDWIQRDRDSSTRQEIVDLDMLITYISAVLLNDGTSSMTPAQAAVIFNRYAR